VTLLRAAAADEAGWADAATTARALSGVVDFDLHGVVTVRVVDPTARDVQVLERQLGPLQSEPATEPDIVVRFVDRIDDPRPLTYVGWPETGFTADAFYLLTGRQGSGRTLLPFQDAGGRCLVVCERSVGPVPHLLSLVNLTALARGVLPLHASAFVLHGQGVLATGWSKGGKTETLLALAGLGARYVGDEWVFLTSEGTMFGLPEPIRLWHWHLRQLPDVWSRLGWGTRLRLAGLSATADGARALGRRLRAGSAAGSVLRRAEPVLRRQAFRQIPPAELFGGHIEAEADLDVLLFVTSHDRSWVEVTPVPSATVAARMRASLAEERAAFMAHYRQFRFAFPDRRSEVVERAPELEQALLDSRLGGLPAFQLGHPYPFDLTGLAGPVAALLRQSGGIT
jgi:hypothetical protein